MDVETKLELIKREPTKEIITDENLRNLLETNGKPEHYIGFEISGLLHVGTLIVSGFKVNDLAKAGVKCKIFLADWHSFINNKLGGDWDNILLASKYYTEAFRFFCPKAEVVLGSNLYHNNDEYWKDLVKFSKKMTLSRNVRCLTIMGRSEKENLDFSQYLYPPMQGVDIKYLGNDMPHGGMDQRKIHVLAREVFPKLKWKTPVPIHHHLLTGLTEPPKTNDIEERILASKMSKSKPWTAVFIHDTPNEIKEKLSRAWCPPQIVETNPVLELARYVIFHEQKSLEVERDKKFGGNSTYDNYAELERDFAAGKLHPMDLKNAVADSLAKILEPIRKHFEKPANKKLLAVYEKVEVTR